MKRFIAVLTAAVVFFGLAASAQAAYSNNFESNTTGWFEWEGSTITQVPSGETNAGGYASGIASAGGSYHARLWRGTCGTENPAGTDLVNCPGPYTDWGGYNYTWTGGYTTQVDIYLDTEYAQANEDSYPGNIGCLTEDSTNTGCKGTRFDFTSAISKNGGGFLRDFGFNVSTGYGQGREECPKGFVVTGQTNVNRGGANPNIGGHDPQCIEESGWYTFKHTFSENEIENEEYLKVVMEIISVETQETVATWTIGGKADPISSVGCNLYGWFSDQEIYGLPIDNASMNGCGVPTVGEGQISPTKTTCEEYRGGTASTLEKVQYTSKGGLLSSLSPGVFFYYGKVSGNEGETVEITQTHTGEAPPIPILNGQVVLYDATTCAKLKWNVEEDTPGEATGELPSTGDFIIGVKYSPSALRGEPVPVPATVTYSFGTTEPATLVLEPKHP